MKSKIVVMVMFALVLASFNSAPQRTITGVITDVSTGNPLPGVDVVLKGTANRVNSDAAGAYRIVVPRDGGKLVFSFVGYMTREVTIGTSDVINVTMMPSIIKPDIIESEIAPEIQHKVASTPIRIRGAATLSGSSTFRMDRQEVWNTEEYDGISENIFHSALRKPLSTFSIDVDAASYSNIRRFINNGQRPPKDAVRIEELINYFEYDYPQPSGEHPFEIITEISRAPWNEEHKLVHIGLQGKRIPTENLPPSNLVFLLDVSGSMNAPNKLPLLKASFKLLTNQLREKDRVAIVVYAGAAGVVLNSTPGSDKRTILDALERLEAGGSTAGGEGLRLAYRIAKENFKKGGNNRIILATDGDFNVGESSNAAMERLVEEKREEGVYLSVLGFGMGNYKDSKMEILADKGNGNYAYIDNIQEAQKVLVSEFGGTLFTIAKDVKLQVEFNPAKVKAYRLIGYENRLLRDEDFNDDKKDAGELGSGHTVTALYEIIPAGSDSKFSPVDDLKYQKVEITPEAKRSPELMTIKFRYKDPDGGPSKLIVHGLRDGDTPLTRTSDNFRWSAAVASFGMLLRESEFVGDFDYEDVLALAEGARGEDEKRYRAGFIDMARSFGLMAKK
ncbi:MAG TPA: von Willebrand factor type A domain-containing protein [Cyclobacteriaceae bacterium]